MSIQIRQDHKRTMSLTYTSQLGPTVIEGLVRVFCFSGWVVS